MAQNNKWTTTVPELLDLFRQSLAVLVPIAEQAKIPWRDGQSYDDWDAIASSLYTHLVVRSLRHAAELHHVALPDYDLVYESYCQMAFISVKGPDIPADTQAAFVAFAGESPHFERVRWIPVLANGDVGDRIEYAQFATSHFSVVQLADGHTPVDSLTISL